jgi:hypothetical protein
MNVLIQLALIGFPEANPTCLAELQLATAHHPGVAEIPKIATMIKLASRRFRKWVVYSLPKGLWQQSSIGAAGDQNAQLGQIKDTTCSRARSRQVQLILISVFQRGTADEVR